jgi:hypothetical protein
MNIYLDDLRGAPPGYSLFTTAEELIEFLQTAATQDIEIDIMSLDNDLGDGYLEGRHVLNWMEEYKFFHPKYKLPKQIIIHSSNGVARQYMNSILKKFKELGVKV